MATRMMTADKQVVLVELPGGRMVNLATEEGALEWLERCTPNVCSKLVRSLERDEDKQQMNLIGMLGALPMALGANHSDKFSWSEIQDVASYFESVLKELAASRTWKQTGVLVPYHQELVGILVPWAKIPLFIKAMMKGGFAALAELMQASKPFPYPYLCETVLMIINNANLTLEKMTFDEAHPLEMVDLVDDSFFYKLEPTGLITQALRALTSPVRDRGRYPIEGYMDFVNCLIRDDKLIKQRCRPGTSLGNTLVALLDGSDGWKPFGDKTNPDIDTVRARLKIFYDKSVLENQVLDAGTATCRHCNKKSRSLKKCGRCKGAAYCSRTCQAADWKQHKKLCNPKTSGQSIPLAQVTQDWLRKNYVSIMEEVARVTRTLGISKMDVVLELDLKESTDPAVVVKPFKDYVEGTGMPDWGFVDVSHIVAQLKDQHARMTKNHILVVHRSYDTDFGLCRFQMQNPRTGFELCSDEALALFPLDTFEKAERLEQVMGRQG